VTPDQPASVANPVPDSSTSVASTSAPPGSTAGQGSPSVGQRSPSAGQSSPLTGAAQSPPTAEPSARLGSSSEPNLPAAQPAANAATSLGPEVIEFANQVVTISEGQTVATVAIRRRGNLSESSVVWWTSDGSALADDDYANLGARIEKFAAGEDTHTIHIPLVGDSKPEGRESFYVNLRNSESAGRRADQAQRMEVVVVDDD
jgi:hypothetical protein